MGLKRKHHGELNKVGISRNRFAQLRSEYADDPEALCQIDIYDPQSEYRVKIRLYADALIAQDEASQQELEAWFQERGYYK